MLTKILDREVSLLGSYRGHWTTGTMAAGIGANSAWFSFRWTDATSLYVPRQIRVGLDSLTGFTAGLGKIDMMFARSFTVNDTGGTASVPTGNNQKTRTSHPTTRLVASLADLRIASTAALGAGTRTLDTVPAAHVNFAVNATANATQLSSFLLFDASDSLALSPLIFAQNEGFILRVTVPATGTWNGHVTLHGDEIAEAL